MKCIARIHCASMQQLVSSGAFHMPSGAWRTLSQSIAFFMASRMDPFAVSAVVCVSVFSFGITKNIFLMFFKQSGRVNQKMAGFEKK